VTIDVVQLYFFRAEEREGNEGRKETAVKLYVDTQFVKEGSWFVKANRSAVSSRANGAKQDAKMAAAFSF
jgi:hypothetical protein